MIPTIPFFDVWRADLIRLDPFKNYVLCWFGQEKVYVYQLVMREDEPNLAQVGSVEVGRVGITKVKWEMDKYIEKGYPWEISEISNKTRWQCPNR